MRWGFFYFLPAIYNFYSMKIQHFLDQETLFSYLQCSEKKLKRCHKPINHCNIDVVKRQIVQCFTQKMTVLMQISDTNLLSWLWRISDTNLLSWLSKWTQLQCIFLKKTRNAAFFLPMEIFYRPMKSNE